MSKSTLTTVLGGVRCPKCKKAIGFDIAFLATAGARFTLTLEPESHRLISAREFGEHISALASQMIAEDKKNDLDTLVFIERLESHADGRLTIGFVTALRKHSKEAKP